MDWQTTTAAIVVAATLTIFLARLARPRKTSGCNHGCGCEKKDHP